MNLRHTIDRYTFAIYLLILLHIFANVIWNSLNMVPPPWDASLHTVITIKFATYLGQNLGSFNLLDFLRISEYYPPFVHISSLPLAFFSSNDYKTIALTSTIFFAISIFALYLYTSKLFTSPRQGVFAAFFFSFFLTVTQQSRDFMLDIPLTTLVILSLYFLEKSSHFTNRKNSILFFIFLALSLVTKWYAIIYIVIPLIYEFVCLIKRGLYKNATIYLTICVGLLISLLICLPWYGTNLQTFLAISKGSLTPEPANPQTLFSLQNWLFNAVLIHNFQIYFTGFIFFLISLFIFIKKLKERPFWMVLSILIFSYIIFTLILTKNVRYTIPMMPFIAIIMGYGANFFWEHTKTRIITFAILGFYLCTYFVTSFGLPFYPSIKHSFNLPTTGPLDLIYLSDKPVKAIYDTNIWPNKEILSTISNSSLKSDNQIVLLNLSDRGYLNGYNLDPNLYSDLPQETKRITIFFLPFLDNKNTVPEEVDFVLVPEKHVALKEGSKQFKNLKRFQNLFLSGGEKNFTLLSSYQVTGDYFHPELFPTDTLLLYKRKDL